MEHAARPGAVVAMAVGRQTHSGGGLSRSAATEAGVRAEAAVTGQPGRTADECATATEP
jgi:hypothetical protein